MESIEDYFSSGSPLEGRLTGFSPRPEQQQMARLVGQAMESGRHLAVEAGAGTGKTLAYLIPALLSGRKVIVATATRTLQDQLFYRDLPMLGSAIGRPAKVAQLKGRANYLCAYRLRRALESSEPRARRCVRDLRVVQEWSQRTQVGDISEIRGMEEGSAAWPLVTSTAENCLGSRCPVVEACHVAAARRRAMEADLTVVNHHLLLADLTLQDDGFGRLLPGASVVIVDEAHRFPETAHSLFDVSFSMKHIEDMLTDVELETAQAGAADEDLRKLFGELVLGIRGAGASALARGEPLTIASTLRQLPDDIYAIGEALNELSLWLATRAELTPGLGRCSERAVAMATIASRLTGWEEGSDLCWAQGGGSGLTFHLTPIDASAKLMELMSSQVFTWIFTSATLAVGDDFSFFAERIGVAPLDTQKIDSPFDYGQCTRLYLPGGLPSPASADYTEKVVAAIKPLLRESQGRAFILFTSRRAVERAAELFAASQHGYTLLVQGRASRSTLLDEFLRVRNAVLLGTSTFWEGVDIRGPALVVVAIDRLPFVSPGDPFMQARLELVRQRGGDPFRDYQLPQAVLALRQGVGRLIRGYEDYGIVMICDPRLMTRSYGRVFLASLPPMPVVHSLEEACAFLASHEGRG